MPQHLTAKIVIEACRKALADGTLLALHPEAARDEDGEIRCAYKVGEYRCAIGVALNNETLDLIDNRLYQADTVLALIDCKIIDVPTSDSFFLRELQALHDAWLKGGPREQFENMLNKFI